MAVGAVGVVSVLSNLIPGEIRKMVHLALEGRFKDATAIHQRLFPLMRAMFLDGNPVGIKHALKTAGRDTGEMRLPLWEASEATKKQISELMGKLGIK
jgi:4-hydroxy-tetrahydrodipicolinate synthase